MSFQSTLSDYQQHHFEILEIDLPVITGACTIDGSPGYGTPSSCDEAWSGEYRTYKFTNMNAPKIPETPVYRVIRSISETTPKIKVGKGLASKGSMSITFNDFVGDPNPDAPGVFSSTIERGTFFGKLNARQIVANKKVRLRCLRVNEGLGAYDAHEETRHYLIESLKNNGNGTWTLQCKDEISLTNEEERSWPISTGSYLRQDINATETTIPVDPDTDWQQLLDDSTDGVLYIRVADEFMIARSVSNNLSSTATLTVDARTGVINGEGTGNFLTRTEVDEHSGGDEIFVCSVSNGERIDDLLARMLTDSGLDPSYIPSADWALEIDTWQTNVVINTLWATTEDLSKQINKVLRAYMIDMWFDPTDREVKISAVSVWKKSVSTITEGKEIRYDTLRLAPVEPLRATRALVVYDKKFLARSKDIENYSKAARFADPQLTQPEFYGDHKDVIFEPSVILDDGSANLLVQRTVSRFSFQPEKYMWMTDENRRTFKIGDVVDIVSTQIQGFDGSYEVATKRAQIISLTPKYNSGMREYKVEALTYEVVAQEGDSFIVNGTIGINQQFNVYDFVGRPADPVEIDFVLDNVTGGSSNNLEAGITLGDFPSGSKINLILANNTTISAKGGDGGKGGDLFIKPADPQTYFVLPAEDGEDGGICLDVNGIDCDIYLSGATNNNAYQTADGKIFAPSGGDGGDASDWVGGSPGGLSGDGGNGGAGRTIGFGGEPGDASGSAIAGAYGQDGLDDFSQPALYAQDGVQGSSSSFDVNAIGGFGGVAGKGVIDSVGGATVNFFIDSGEVITDRYINGNGDFP